MTNGLGDCLRTPCFHLTLLKHRRRKIFISEGGGGILVKRAEGTSRAVGTLYARGIRGHAPRKILNFRCVFLQSGGI